jgi:hypothetical protein
VIHAPACNIYSFLRRDTYVPSTQLNKPIWSKPSPSTPQKTYFAVVIPFKY